MTDNRKLIFVASAILAAGGAAEPRLPPAEEEARLIQVLQAGGGAEEQIEACVRLQRAGTERAVPALAALLADPQVSHAARYALETMAAPAAGRALTAALESTSGAERIGVIGSLGGRREAAAAPVLARMLAGSTTAVPLESPEGAAARVELGAAAAAALGGIEAPAALAALEDAWGVAGPPLREAVIDAVLQQAVRKLAAGQRNEARRLFAEVYRREAKTHHRIAGFQGMMRAASDGGRASLTAALGGPAGPEQAAALRQLPEIAVRGLGRELAALLPRLAPDLQVAVLGAWMQRNDLPDRAVVAPLLDSPEPAVRQAALHALGAVGGARDVERLAVLAAAAGPEQKAARAALIRLQEGDVAGRLVTLLGETRAEVQAEAARALGQRGDRMAVKRLLVLAGAEAEPTRVAALRALVLLVDERQFDALIRLVAGANEEAKRAETARAVALVLERLQPASGSPALRALQRELAQGTTATRVALVPACSVLARTETRDLLRLLIADADPLVRTAAVRAAAQTVDPDLLPDLLKLAGSADDEAEREWATRACVRLLVREGAKFSDDERLEILRTLAAGAANTGQKRAVLTGLGGGRTLAELELAGAYLAEDTVKHEAAVALLKIAPRLAEAEAALASLQRLRRDEGDEEFGKEIEAAIKSVQARAAYVTVWQSAAPFRASGRRAEELIDTVFAPEIATVADFRTAAGRQGLAEWEPLRLGADARTPMLMRGGGVAVYGVAYAYTWLRSPHEQQARIEIGHDEAIQVWLNEREVFRHEGLGTLPPKETAQVEVPLPAGWSLLRVKIAQPAKNWAFSVRVVGADGKHLTEAAAEPETPSSL